MPSTYAAGKFKRAGQDGAVVIQGFAGLQRALRNIEDGVQPELRRKIRVVGSRVAFVAGSRAPRLTGALQHSVKVSVTTASASVYSTSEYGGVQNVGGWTQHGRGPHVKRAEASHYMDRTVRELGPWVEGEMNSVMDWLMTTFEGE